MIFPHQKYLQHLLKKYDLAPLKHLSQSFLVDRSMAQKIYDCLELKAGDHVIEVGPGFGAMTYFFLQKKNIFLTTIEIDKGIVSYLKELREESSVKEHWNLVHGDVLKYEWKNFFQSHCPSKLLSNLPYGITGPFLMQLLKNKDALSHCILLLQDSVVKKILAPVRSKDYNRLSIYFHLWASVLKGFDVPRECFYPRPRVDSAVIRFDFKKPLVDIDCHFFMNFLSHVFGQRRKMIGKTLKKFFYRGKFLTENEIKLLFRKTNIDCRKRPQELFPEDFVGLVQNLKDIVRR